MPCTPMPCKDDPHRITTPEVLPIAPNAENSTTRPTHVGMKKVPNTGTKALSTSSVNKAEAPEDSTTTTTTTPGNPATPAATADTTVVKISPGTPDMINPGTPTAMETNPEAANRPETTSSNNDHPAMTETGTTPQVTVVTKII